MIRIIPIALLLAIWGAPVAQPRTLLKNAFVVDPAKREILTRNLVLEGGLISQITPSPPDSFEGTVVDLTKEVRNPGIDRHAHPFFWQRRLAVTARNMESRRESSTPLRNRNTRFRTLQNTVLTSSRSSMIMRPDGCRALTATATSLASTPDYGAGWIARKNMPLARWLPFRHSGGLASRS